MRTTFMLLASYCAIAWAVPPTPSFGQDRQAGWWTTTDAGLQPALPTAQQSSSSGRPASPMPADQHPQHLSAGGRVIYDSNVRPVANTESAANRQESDRLLVDARLALAKGDLRRAEQLVGHARVLNFRYGQQEDNPTRVQELIRQVDNLQKSGANPNSISHNLQQFDLLITQAEALLWWNQLDAAERLASKANQLKASVRPHDPRPGDLLNQITATRRSNAEQAGLWAPKPPPQPTRPTGALVATNVPTANNNPSGGPTGSADPGPAANLPIGGPGQPLQQFPSAEQVQAGQVQAGQFAGGGQVPATGQLRPSGDIQRTGGIPPAEVGLAGTTGRMVVPTSAVGSLTESSPIRSARPRTEAGINQRSLSGQPPVSLAGPSGPVTADPAGEARRLVTAAENALRQGNPEESLRLYTQAYRYRDHLDPQTLSRVQEKLQLLPQSVQRSRQTAGGPVQPAGLRTDGLQPVPSTLLDQAVSEQLMATKRLAGEVARNQMRAQKMKEEDPKGALQLLQQTRQRIEESKLPDRQKGTLLSWVDRDINDVQEWLSANRANIELEERNERVRESIDREREYKIEVQQELARLVEQYNELMDQYRYKEAQLIARRAQMIAPEEPVAQNMVEISRIASNLHRHMSAQQRQADGFAHQMLSVRESAEPPLEDFSFGTDATSWKELTARRGAMARRRQRLSESELEIQDKLLTKVLLKFSNAPLAQVLDQLGKLAGINIHLDPQGLRQEGISSTTPVTINLQQEISLRSALNLILEDKNLTYIIKDEVLKVTSYHLRDGEVYTEVYDVGDLVIPIPNFVPSGQIGLASAINDALAATRGASLPAGIDPRAVHDGLLQAQKGFGAAVAARGDGVEDALAQPLGGLNPGGGFSSSGGSGLQGIGMGTAPNGGSGAQPDFDSLIELITSTIKPNSWAELGGPGSIRPYEANLTLIVSQTEQIHEQIADLLGQLRRLQDLQVTLEVRFITLSEEFFERIGVDFDFEIDDDIDGNAAQFGQADPSFVQLFDGSGANPGRDFSDRDDIGDTLTVGLTAPGVFAADLDIPVNQGSFGMAVPQFGGFTPGAGATFGFAILSDIEAFFFIEASEGDTRANVLQAPKVTLFNGQVAFVADTIQTPFVISVVPVVGDFAAAYQPVIVVLSEGTFLTVQAVVSKDRRFVRLTLVPFFSEIRGVDTFTFDGRETSVRRSSEDQDSDSSSEQEEEQLTRSGTTVQLPTFAFVTVTTTVSVPDGGTVLLGGIKRLSEGRNEFGVPILSKIPYVNRLFRNVGIGRESSSLMLMVTPRIIIQEEEEERLIGTGGQ